MTLEPKWLRRCARDFVRGNCGLEILHLHKTRETMRSCPVSAPRKPMTLELKNKDWILDAENSCNQRRANNYSQGQNNGNLDQPKIVTLTQIQDRIKLCLIRGIRGLDKTCAVQHSDQRSCVPFVHDSRESVTLAPVLASWLAS